jgi:hypothetical protein
MRTRWGTPTARREGMNNPNDLHSWSKHYREEVTREAQRQRTYLSGRERAERGLVAA